MSRQRTRPELKPGRGVCKATAPIRDGETYTKELLRNNHGIGTRAWNRLVKAGMPVDYIGNRVYQKGEVIREWIARVAAQTRNAKLVRIGG